MEHKNSQGGFFMGLLIGAAVGALVSTKKGRQILKDLADYGMEYVENTVNLDNLETILDEEEEEMMSGETPDVTEDEEEVVEKKPAKKKRLFRGIRKK